MGAAAISPHLRLRDARDGVVLQHVQAEMIKAIREAGRTPVQRNTFYEVLADGDQLSVRESEPLSGKSRFCKTIWRRRDSSLK